jgi:hypothetical protein
MELHGDFTISLGNPTYAPASLSNDLYEVCEDFEIMRLVGRIGKPASNLTMITAPGPSQSQVILPESLGYVYIASVSRLC